MAKRITIPPVLFLMIAPFLAGIILIGAAILFLTFFFRMTWRAVAATETVLTLKSEVAMESLERSRFERVLKALKEKTKERVIDWKKLKDPF